MQCPTVRIRSSHPEHVDGFIVINESDYDPNVHEIWEGAKATDDESAERLMAEMRARDQSAKQKEADARKAAFAKSARDVVNLRDR